ncbi:MAG: hypothetical protein AAGF98_15205 [Cyanobacteria bacterium P01_H01_bin.153]
MVKVSCKVIQLPVGCSDRLLNNAQNLADKVINLTRVPCVDEWIDFNGLFYKVVKVKHMPMAALQDATVEVEYCEYENGEIKAASAE